MTELRLEIEFSDGLIGILDFAAVSARGGVFDRLRDPSYFSRVAIGESGRYIEWPEELDFCADALWLETQKAVKSADIPQSIASTAAP